MLAVSYVDLILARQLLPAAEAGAYAVGSVLTKGALWAPQVVTVLALPRFAKGDAGSIRVATGAVALCGAVLVTATALAGDLAMRLAGGAGYTGLGGHAPLFAASGALYSLTFVLVNALIAAGARWPSAPLWAATVLLAGGAQLLPHPTAGSLIGLAVGTAAATLLATAVAYRSAKRHPTALSSAF
jgi:O-antigen/teichoic acid export membrane protein